MGLEEVPHSSEGRAAQLCPGLPRAGARPQEGRGRARPTCSPFLAAAGSVGLPPGPGLPAPAEPRTPPRPPRAGGAAAGQHAQESPVRGAGGVGRAEASAPRRGGRRPAAATPRTLTVATGCSGGGRPLQGAAPSSSGRLSLGSASALSMGIRGSAASLRAGAEAGSGGQTHRRS